MRDFKKILVTGGAGFIGSNFIHQLLANRQQISVINLDKLTYAGNPHNLDGIPERYGARYQFVKGCITNFELVRSLVQECDAIVHFAAESHVDRSILGASIFIETNVKGTLTLLEATRQKKDSCRFVHVSTDEVYGELGDEGAFTEQTPLSPNSPYSASKASSDLLVRAFVKTHALDAVITRCSNNYGPRHFPEKLIPLMITNAMDEVRLPVYGEGLNVRDWIYVDDHCAGVLAALEYGRTGEVYNLGGRAERRNIDVVRNILMELGKSESLIEYVVDRKGHDWRYAIDCSKAERELHWGPSVRFEEGLRETIRWYQSNESWWRPLKERAAL